MFFCHDGSASTLRKIKIGTIGKRIVAVEITAGGLVKPNANFASDPSIEVTATSAQNVRYVAFNHDQKRYVEA